MTIYSTDNRAGVQPLLDVSSVQNLDLGTVVRYRDTNTGSGSQGAGEVIYLQGASSTIRGSVVTYNTRDGSTTLVPTNSVGSGAPVAVALAATNTTGTYGWYGIAGVFEVAKGTVDFGLASPIYRSASVAGYISSAVGSGGQILGARTVNSASVSSVTSTIWVEFNRPHLQGQIL
jgi:hypothetical protein